MSGAEAAVVASQTAEDRDGLRLLGVSVSSIRRRSTTIARTAGTRRSGGRSSSVLRA